VADPSDARTRKTGGVRKPTSEKHLEIKKEKICKNILLEIPKPRQPPLE